MKRTLTLLALSLLLAPVGTAQEMTFTHFAGTNGGPGWSDGPVASARLCSPGGVAVDNTGIVYFSDRESHTIRRLTPAGVVSTVAGLAGRKGSADGRGSAAQFSEPRGIAIDGAGNLLVADSGNHTIRRVSPAGVVTTLAGRAGESGSADGSGTQARFWTPWALSRDLFGDFLVADSGNSRIRRISAAGVVTTLKVQSGAVAAFSSPRGVAMDPLGNVYVAEGAYRHTIARLTPAGVLSVFAGTPWHGGSGDGPGAVAQFREPGGIVADASGALLVSDEFNSTIRRVTPEGVVTTVAGMPEQGGARDGTGAAAQFRQPQGLALDRTGNLVIADVGNRTLRRMTPSAVVTTIAGRARIEGNSDGPASQARFRSPAGVALDAAGNAYVADARNWTVRKVTPAGLVSTLAGLAGASGGEDGIGSAARFTGPEGVAVDAGGNVFVTDIQGHTLRRITPEGVVTTLAGSPGLSGSEDGAGSQARFSSPTGVAVDGAGNAYVADSGNDVIRRVTPQGVVTTLRGLVNGPGEPDAGNPAPAFNGLTGIAVDAAGFVYVLEQGNGTIRKVGPDGSVTTVAGTARVPGARDGTRWDARFRLPVGMALDSEGTLWVVDRGAGTVRRVTAAGEVTTAAGLAQELTSPWVPVGERISVDGTGPSARFNDLRGIAVGADGRVLVTDATDQVLRLGVPALADVATIDAPAGPVGAERRLGTSPQTATEWRWEPLRIESGSTASLGPATARDPAFTPDVDGLFVFRLTASNGSRSRISTVALAAGSVSPTAVLSEQRDLCLGSSVQLHADLTGTPPWSLVWSDGFVQNGVLESPATRIASPVVDTTYLVTSVSDQQGPGTTSGSASVTLRTLPTVAVTDYGSVSVCAGHQADVYVVLTGTPPFLVTWSDGATQLFSSSGGGGRRVFPTSTTTYSPTSVSDASCTGTATGSRTIATIPVPTAIASGSTTICAGQSTQIRADLTGVAPWRVVWSDGQTDDWIYTSPARRVVGPSSTTTYTVTWVSDQQCLSPGTGSATVTVRPQPAPATKVTTPAVASPGAPGLVASVPDAGAGATYAWTISNGAITAGEGTVSITYTAGSKGFCVLHVTVSVPGGCTASGSTAVRIGDDPAPPLHFTHLAGSGGGAGWFDGPTAAARFRSPSGLTVDGAGNAFVADRYNHTIRKVSARGVVTTLAGLAGVAGSADGKGSGAQFRQPASVVVDAGGNVYVADTGNSTIRKVTPAGVVSTLAGTPGVWGAQDGVGSAALFGGPLGLALDGSGNLFVTDSIYCTIRKVTPAGVVSTFAGSAGYAGWSDGTGTSSSFSSPAGLARDGTGNLYVADRDNHTVRKVTPEGVVTTVAGSPRSWGHADGNGTAARFANPYGVAADAAGNLWITDGSNFTVRRMTAAGAVTTIAGLVGVKGSADGTGSSARFMGPTGISVEGPGLALLTDSEGHAIRRVTSEGVVSTFAGQAGESGTIDATGPAARFLGPSDVAVDGFGNAYVAEPEDHTIRKVTPAGEVTTLAGLSGVSGGRDGAGAAARFDTPSGVACDADGNVYVADRANNAIRKVTPAGEVTTLAGLGFSGSSDGMGPLARFNNPSGVALDREGNVFVADRHNHTIRRVAPDGRVSTVAGTARVSGNRDGLGAAASFYFPGDVAVDGQGNVYVVDTYNQSIRRITPDGMVTTLAGLSGVTGASDGIGTAARFYYPEGIATDGAGNVWVADWGNHAIRRMTAAGEVTTVGGSLRVGGSVDGTGTSAQFLEPTGLAVGLSGNLLVADTMNFALRSGVAALPDAATIDATTGPAGSTRQLGATPRTATTWRWELVRRESGSSATLSSTSIPDPTFTPDVPGYYRFRLTASDGVRTSTTIVSLAAGLPAPTATVIGAPTTLCSGATASLEARLTGTPPWDVTWSDGFRQAGLLVSSGARTVRPMATTTYFVSSVSDATGPGSSSGSREISVLPAPETPVIDAPAVVSAYSPRRVASVAAHPGSTYSWSVSSGSITSGQGTNRVEFQGLVVGELTITVTEIAANGCRSPQASATVTVLPEGTATLFYPVAPCRILDTRDANGPTQGRPLDPGATLLMSAVGTCGVSFGAWAAAMNVTVTQPAAAGELCLFPGSGPPPLASTLSFAAGKTRANGTVLGLSSYPPGTFSIYNGSAGTAHVLVDVSGYFE